MSKAGINRNLPNDAYEAATNANAPSALNPFVTEVDAAVTAASLILYPTTAASGVPTYNKLVNAITEPDYDDPAVDLSTGAITGAAQLIAELASDEGVISGNPGTVNVNTIGNIRRVSGSGTATFYFEIYHRDNLGTETLLGTSNTTYDATSAVYEQFFASALITGITFGPTDRVVTKWYANRVPGASDPTYEIQLGGATPVKITFPVPLASLPTGGVDGSGTTNYIPKWTPDGDTLGDSLIQDDGTTVSVNTSPLASGQFTVQNSATAQQSFYGLANQNAATNIAFYGVSSGGTSLVYGGQFVATDGGGGGKVVGLYAYGGGIYAGLPASNNIGGIIQANNTIIGSGDSYGTQVASVGASTGNNIGLYAYASNSGAGSHWAAQFVDGTEGAGKVLTSDAQGRASWQTPGGGGGSGVNWIPMFSGGLFATNQTFYSNWEEATGIQGNVETPFPAGTLNAFKINCNANSANNPTVIDVMRGASVLISVTIPGNTTGIFEATGSVAIANNDLLSIRVTIPSGGPSIGLRGGLLSITV
jgi:hypothetical protein